MLSSVTALALCNVGALCWQIYCPPISLATDEDEVVPFLVDSPLLHLANVKYRLIMLYLSIYQLSNCRVAHQNHESPCTVHDIVTTSQF